LRVISGFLLVPQKGSGRCSLHVAAAKIMQFAELKDSREQPRGFPCSLSPEKNPPGQQEFISC
jgi:hypothetical protein